MDDLDPEAPCVLVVGTVGYAPPGLDRAEGAGERRFQRIRTAIEAMGLRQLGVDRADRGMRGDQRPRGIEGDGPDQSPSTCAMV